MNTPQLPETQPSIPGREFFIRHRKLTIIVLILLVLGILALWHRHNTLLKQNADAANRPLPVVLGTARSADVPVYISALGTVTPTYSVTVRTQVNGVLLRVLFQEGQMVKAGEVLAEIDPRPYQAQLAQAQGQLARDQALLANAHIDLKRYAGLYPQGGVPKQTYDTQASLVKQLEGTVQADQGQVDSAKINLAYCQITSPIDGRVGLRLVDPGNFVQTSNTNGIVVVNTIKPITVVFSISEDNIPQVIQQIDAGKKLSVKAYDRDQHRLLATGELLTLDNQIDPTTGTAKLKAQFQNNDYSLFPNQFVNIDLLVNTLQNATVVPTAAVQHGVNGDYVYVYNSAKQIVNLTSVKTSVASGDDTVVTSGVMPGQQVVVEGADKLTDGARVSVSGSAKATSVQ